MNEAQMRSMSASYGAARHVIAGGAGGAAWGRQREALEFIAGALRTQADDATLAAIAARVDATIADWHAIDGDRRRLRRAVTEAAARVQVADTQLDRLLGAFAGEVLALVGNDARAALYTRFFPEPHEDVIDLGLDAEIPVAMLVVAALSDESRAGSEIPASLRAHLEPLRAALQQGTGALAARAEALAELGRSAARVIAWREGAASTERAVRRALTRVAAARALPPRWVDAFFPRVAR